MERGTTLLLKATVCLLALPVLAVCLVGLPLFARNASDLYPAYWLYPLIVIAYASAIPYFMALYQSFKLLIFIDRNDAFSDGSVLALRKIKLFAIAIAVLFTASLPFLYFIADQDDAPGLIIIGMVIIFASIIIAAFAAVLQKLLQNAIAIKSENDLTV
ncbi:DUF2975 domain-containing protein [Paenibacillus lycopersici]|uniref:DUF2975 domain-containing protein n=1 Tax=Paenibacillus lycopersici TaxID=2704462 RepID=A0A6C0FXZ1_9BACL|nr:DUF2975 domain-containing protein [Paenibacillus lycopersici]QHT60932.1 DUF2975 domain-containing protein [Paenibacillus lycopersici]